MACVQLTLFDAQDRRKVLHPMALVISGPHFLPVLRDAIERCFEQLLIVFSHAANGDLVSSFITQPMGMLLAVGAAVTVVVGTYTAVTGSMLAPFLGGMFSTRVIWILVVLLMLAWIWKIVDHRGIL